MRCASNGGSQRPSDAIVSAMSVRLMTFDGARRRHPDVARWFANDDTGLRELVRPWFDAMRECGPDVVELLHDGQPTACVGNVAFAYVDAFSAHASVGFFLGASLSDPAGLLEGSGKFMRHVKVRPHAPLKESALFALVEAAYEDIRVRVADRDRSMPQPHGGA